MYKTQIIVTSELSPENHLYLRCLTNNLCDSDLTNKRKDGVTPMYCEGLFELFGTSSKEIEEKATDNAFKKAQSLYLPQINALNKRIELLEAQLAARNN